VVIGFAAPAAADPVEATEPGDEAEGAPGFAEVPVAAEEPVPAGVLFECPKMASAMLLKIPMAYLVT
jgi:hypothetical protein